MTPSTQRSRRHSVQHRDPRPSRPATLLSAAAWPLSVPACLSPPRCRIKPYLDQGGACGAAGSAPAAASGLGRPGRRAPSHSGETRRSIRLIRHTGPGSVLLAAPSRSVPAHSDQTPGQYPPHGCLPGGRPFAVAPSTTWADDRRRCKAPTRLPPDCERLRYGVKGGCDRRATNSGNSAWSTYTQSRP